MRAADHRRLTPWLAMVVALVLALLVALVLGWGQQVSWDRAPVEPATGAHKPVASRAATSPPPTRFAAAWEHPLFSADRQPHEATGGNGEHVSLGDLVLTGIILTPGLHMALMHDAHGDKDVRVREGETLPDSAWRLKSLAARHAVFVGGGPRTELTLKVAHADASAGPKGDAGQSAPPPVRPASASSPPDEHLHRPDGHPRPSRGKADAVLRPPRQGQSPAASGGASVTEQARQARLKRLTKQYQQRHGQQAKAHAKGEH
ncbi:general secretion pathway protein GspN [Oleiagrimonas sp. C23AA]|uniref:general secretion pathway protein GspN n=1 Tax=Oleiagrimonas sp. C23AA TaxID=2719047 RepID=UPI00142478E4|nr:general secretion pathway protein GspN [Oleiagrimonas sp. C23AA]NII11279.1 general secretion pathway protein GspN [Oleiagrimonas sp. C23AA]